LIGGEVVSTFLDRGWSVTAIARAENDDAAGRRIRERLAKSHKKASSLDRLTCLAGSVTEPDLGLDPRVFEGVSTILHAAGETAFNNDVQCWNTNVGAAEKLVELVRRQKARPRLFFMSTASVVMTPTHGVVTEEMPFGGYDNGYTRSKRQAERVIAESGLGAVILRPTIVFSRGVEDRKMARAMLWVIPAMMELGSAPVEGESRLDIAPVDYVAHATELLLRKPRLSHSLYHISAGEKASISCHEIQETVSRDYPRANAVALVGGSSRKKPGKRPSLLERRLEESISYYVPFMSADIVYSDERMRKELGPELGECPPVTDYLVSLLGQFEFQEGIEESAKP
jgi:nucleoside-diphosphate-sugar epimerase